MAALFPGVHRKATAIDSFLEGGFVEDKPLEATADVKAAKDCCGRCGEAREEWDFDALNVCKGCGDVVERPLDSGAEYRFFGLEDRGSSDPCRVGAPMDTRFPGSALGTVILSHAQGGNASTRIAMARVRRYHTWNLLPYRERSLLQVFEQIALAATNHGFDVRTMDLAKEMYVKLVEHCDRRGMSRTSVIASCIYSALKQVGAPRKPKEVADIFHLSTAQFTKSLKYFQEILTMAHQRGLLADGKTPSSQPSTRASNYISNPLSHLPIQRATFASLEAVAKAIADELEDKELCPENMPPSLAAGVITFVLKRAVKEPVSNEKIAEVCGVSEGTLVKCLKKIEIAATGGYLESAKHLV
jgi:transcription initiation factor TFIIIB Brf1 subunit/transcription initiation factor TFIIB